MIESMPSGTAIRRHGTPGMDEKVPVALNDPDARRHAGRQMPIRGADRNQSSRMPPRDHRTVDRPECPVKLWSMPACTSLGPAGTIALPVKTGDDAVREVFGDGVAEHCRQAPLVGGLIARRSGDKLMCFQRSRQVSKTQ